MRPVTRLLDYVYVWFVQVLTSNSVGRIPVRFLVLAHGRIRLDVGNNAGYATARLLSSHSTRAFDRDVGLAVET